LVANSYLRVYQSPGTGVLFEWFPCHAAECGGPLLSGYNGLLQSDGYGAYPVCPATPDM
jgi:hypothetical protein